jgi:hypothetical protein
MYGKKMPKGKKAMSSKMMDKKMKTKTKVKKMGKKK